MEDRCTLTDLLVSSCGHCRGDDGLPRSLYGGGTVTWATDCD